MESLEETGAICLYAIICHSPLNNVKHKGYRDVGNGMWQKTGQENHKCITNGTSNTISEDCRLTQLYTVLYSIIYLINYPSFH